MKKQITLFLILLSPFYLYSQNFWKSLGGPNGNNIAGIVSLEIKDNSIFVGTQGPNVIRIHAETCEA